MSTAENPYQAPQTNVAPPPLDSAALPLASPWLRLAAAIIDGIVLYPINWLLGKLFFHTPTYEEATEAVRKYGVEGAMKELMPSTPMMIVAQVLGVVAFLAVNFVFLKKGQTIGKLALKLQIQNRTNGSLLSVQDIILKRVLPVYLVGALGMAIHWSILLILTVDVLCIFRPGRNTLHDDLANTKVVKMPG
jgi:uncharacterized RDD family membrane protein YckC